MTHLFLINLLLILAGPFAAVGALAAVATLSCPGFARAPQARPVRPAMRWAVA